MEWDDREFIEAFEKNMRTLSKLVWRVGKRTQEDDSGVAMNWFAELLRERAALIDGLRERVTRVSLGPDSVIIGGRKTNQITVDHSELNRKKLEIVEKYIGLSKKYLGKKRLFR